MFYKVIIKVHTSAQMKGKNRGHVENLEDQLNAKVFTANFNPKHVILSFIT